MIFEDREAWQCFRNVTLHLSIQTLAVVSLKKRMKLTSSPFQNESAPGPLLSSTPRDRPISSQPISSQQGIKYGSEENGLPAPKKETPRRADSVKMQHRCHFLKCWISSLPFNLFWLCRIHSITLRYIDLEGRSVFREGWERWPKSTPVHSLLGFRILTGVHRIPLGRALVPFIRKLCRAACDAKSSNAFKCNLHLFTGKLCNMQWRFYVTQTVIGASKEEADKGGPSWTRPRHKSFSSSRCAFTAQTS